MVGLPVLPQPKAPGIAVVPPWTQLEIDDRQSRRTDLRASIKGNIREQRIEDTLTSKERRVGSKLVDSRSGSSDWPELHERVLGLFALELCLHDDVLHQKTWCLAEFDDSTV